MLVLADLRHLHLMWIGCMGSAGCVVNPAQIVEIDGIDFMKAHLVTYGEFCLPLFSVTSYYL